MFAHNIPLIDLESQQKHIRLEIEEALKRVLNHGQYVMGPEVFQLEKQLSNFCGAKHSLACSNGTDALGMALMAYGVGPGDAIFVPSFTFAATAEVVSWMGATPVFIDSLKETYNMDPESLVSGIDVARRMGLNPVGVIPVDLFGLPADYDALCKISEQWGMWVIADAAQSFGAVYQGRSVGTLGHITTTSFFPAKPLGCYGDGGALFTDSDELAEKIKSIRVHGQGQDKYENIRIGINGRLDTMQAAILIEKLKIFPQEIIRRQEIAKAYHAAFCGKAVVVPVPKNDLCTWAQYTLTLPDSIDRDQLIKNLIGKGIGCAVYYVRPLHLQKAYQNYPVADGKGLSVCEKLSKHVISLPMNGYLTMDQCNYVIEKVLETLV